MSKLMTVSFTATELTGVAPLTTTFTLSHTTANYVIYDESTGKVVYDESTGKILYKE